MRNVREKGTHVNRGGAQRALRTKNGKLNAREKHHMGAKKKDRKK